MHARIPFRWFVLLPAFLSLVIPATAWSDIYKWTDEQGRTNLSNVPPTPSGKVKNVEVALKETKTSPERAAAANEQALLARIENLERQLQARQYAAPPPGAPAPAPYASYYPPPPPPPSASPSYYDSGYYGNYPSYYPTYYYPVAPAYSYAVYSARSFVGRPAFAAPRVGYAHGGFSHGGGGHRGRR